MNPLIELYKNMMALKDDNPTWDHHKFVGTMMDEILAASVEQRDEYQQYAEKELIAKLAKQGITLTIEEVPDESSD